MVPAAVTFAESHSLLALAGGLEQLDGLVGQRQGSPGRFGLGRA